MKKANNYGNCPIINPLNFRVNLLGAAGVGKTTLFEALKEKYQLFVYKPEVFEEHMTTPDILKRQIAFMTQYLTTLSNIQKGRIYSIVTDALFFPGLAYCQTHKELGNMPEEDYEAYLKRFEVFLGIFWEELRSFAHIFLYANPEEIFDNIHKKRKRNGEEWLTLEFIEKLQINMEKIVNKYGGRNVVKIDTSTYFPGEIPTGLNELFTRAQAEYILEAKICQI